MEREKEVAHEVAIYYPLYQPVKIRWYGSLINFIPSASNYLFLFLSGGYTKFPLQTFNYRPCYCLLVYRKGTFYKNGTRKLNFFVLIRPLFCFSWSWRIRQWLNWFCVHLEGDFFVIVLQAGKNFVKNGRSILDRSRLEHSKRLIQECN